MKGMTDLLMKSLGPMLEKFKPELQQWMDVFKKQADTIARIESKLDAALKHIDFLEGRADALAEHIAHLELKSEEHDDRLGIVPETPPSADGGEHASRD